MRMFSGVVVIIYKSTGFGGYTSVCIYWSSLDDRSNICAFLAYMLYFKKP